MTEPRATTRARRFLRFTEPRGRDLGAWIILCTAAAVRLVTDDDRTDGWAFPASIVLLAAGLVGLVVSARRLRKFHGVPDPDECPACGHFWSDHAGGAGGVCAGCAHEIEYGVPPRVAGGCRLSAPANT